MNVGIVLKFEYRILPDGTFAEMALTVFSGKIAKTVNETPAGYLHETTVSLQKPKVGKETTDLLDAITGRKLECRVTDGNGTVHLFGSLASPARLTYSSSIGGSPGSWNGYSISVVHKSTGSYAIT